MNEKKAEYVAFKTWVMSELTGIDPDSILRYFAALEAIPDGDLHQISFISNVSYSLICEISEVDRGIHVAF